MPAEEVKVSVTIIVNPFPTADYSHCPLMKKPSHFPSFCCRCNILSTHQPPTGCVASGDWVILIAALSHHHGPKSSNNPPLNQHLENQKPP